MDALPVTGSVEVNALPYYTDSEFFYDRDARVQGEGVDTNLRQEQRSAGQQLGTYNVYWGSFSGGGRRRANIQAKARRRCVLSTDAGVTLGSNSPSGRFCLYFSRGHCSQGRECSFIHRSPATSDSADPLYDVFGRERHRDHRQDMGGVGSFESESTVLHVSNVGKSTSTSDALLKHFQEWGLLSRITLVPSQNSAYVAYTSRLCAEFAKEAMNGQALDGNEVLACKWAPLDGGYDISIATQRKHQIQVLDAIVSRLPIVGERGTILDYDNGDGEYFDDDNDEEGDENADNNQNADIDTSEYAVDPVTGFYVDAVSGYHWNGTSWMLPSSLGKDLANADGEWIQTRA